MSDLVSLKITIENEANYLLFGSRICHDINELAAFCRNRYQDLQKNVDDFLYYWIDDDGDAIRITTDEDYQSFLQAMANVKARLYVADKNATVAETSLIKEEINVQAELDDAPMQNVATGDAVPSRPVHQHAICDVCDGQIVGHRYKCLTCHDYDLCMGCEAKFRHKDHLMLRIPKPVMVDRSQSTVSRMLDKLRVYSARIASTIERDLGPEEETNATAGNESAEITGTKRANARSVHRSKHRAIVAGKLLGLDATNSSNSAVHQSDHVIAIRKNHLRKSVRRACRRCYSLRRNAMDRLMARANTKKVITYCANCPDEPQMCETCFNIVHHHKYSS